MNRKIATRSGLITGLAILSFNMVLVQWKFTQQSPLQLIQFSFVLFGMLGSCFMLTRHYAGISLGDYIKHCLRTLSTLMFIVIAGNTILYFIFRKPDEPWANLTFMIMKTIFSYSVSGALSAFFTSFLFNTFTKK
jgi:hypothetical protein